MFLKPKL